MRPDRFSLAKAWINDERSTPEEAKATWETMSKEFDENRKAMLMASAESDKIKAMMNKKFGSGTMKYGSEIPQPPQRPDVIQIDAVNRFMRDNPMAEGGRMEFGDGGITEITRGPDTGKFHIRIGGGGDRKTFVGTKAYVERQVKLYRENQAKKRIPSNKLTPDKLKTVLKWGKNKSEALGETWSDKKTLKEYNNLSEDMRTKVRSGKVSGTGGSWSEGQITSLNKKQQKLWDATMADEFGKWEDYPQADRNRWKSDFPRKQKIYSQTKDLLNIDELAEFLSKKFNVDISRNKIKGGSFSGKEARTALGKYINDNLFVDTFGSIKGNIEGEVRGNVSYYKKPTDTQINQIKKQNLVFDTRTNTLKPKTLENIKMLNEMYGDVYRSGNIPKLKDMIDATGLSGGEIARAEAKLAQIYNGHKFRNGPTDIRVNKNTANKLFEFMSKAQFGDPRKNELYDISLDLIDEGLGNEKNTFYNLKDKAKNILKENGIKVHSIGSPTGFNIDEFAGVTGSGRSKSMAVSQFINIMEGNLNTKTLQNFQGQLSKARQAVEAVKGTPSYNSVLKKQMEKINTRAIELEKKNGIKLARLERPADINNMSADEVKRLKNIKIGTGENLYQRLVKDAKASGYSIKVPEGSLTIQEFTDPNNARARELIALVGCPNFKGKQAFAEGGRTGFSEGGDCFDEGVKKMNNGMKGTSQASKINAAKFLNNAYKTGRNIMKFGIIPEAIFVAGETLLRSLGDQTLEEGLKSSIGFYTDWTGLTDFKSDARISQNMRNMGVDATMNIERLVKFNDATDKVNKLKQMKESDLAVNDESLTGFTDQEVAANADKNIAKAQEYLDKNFLKESEKLFFSQQQDEAADIAGTRSPFQKFLGEARNKTENMRYEPDFTGMQSDMFTIDPMSAKAKKDRVKNLPPQSPLTGSKGEQEFLKLSQLPMGPRMGSEIDVLAKAMNENFKAQGLDQRTDAAYLKAMQDYKNNYKNMTMEEMLAIGIPREAIYGFNQPEVIKEKPVYDFSEGGITGLRSKYEYKK